MYDKKLKREAVFYVVKNTNYGYIWKTVGRESVPSGASTGRFEAIELRDGTERYFGLSEQKVVEHINTRIRQEIVGMNVLDQVCIDRKLVELDGTDNKGNLGANALLGV